MDVSGVIMMLLKQLMAALSPGTVIFVIVL
jgi:hypothetical protein